MVTLGKVNRQLVSLKSTAIFNKGKDGMTEFAIIHCLACLVLAQTNFKKI